MLVPRLSRLEVHCPKEHALHRITYRAQDGNEVFAGIRLTYCKLCGAFWPVRAEPKAPHPKSIREYAPLIRDELEKLEVDLKNWPYIKKLFARRKTYLISKVQEKAWGLYGKTPDYRTVERVLEFCAEAGEKASFVVNGVIRPIKENGESYIRYPDPLGIDPPFAERLFKCPKCGKKYSADDMMVYERYYCLDCLTWLTYDGFDVIEATPYSGFAHVEGSIVDKAMGGPMSKIPVAIAMKACETDHLGHFRLEYVPCGVYDLKILINGRQVRKRIEVSGSFKPLMLALAECHECSYIWVDDKVNHKFACPNCNTQYLCENDRIYKLKHEEAFCYDFKRDWAWWWKLRCPNCNTEASLEFSNGRWICTQCGLYVEPKHDYRFFRCLLPCGHENPYSIHYLINSIQLKCWICGFEADLPPHIKEAWRNLNYTIFDIPANIMVNGEYFVRKNPWVVPAALIGVPLIGLGLALLASGGKDEK